MVQSKRASPSSSVTACLVGRLDRDAVKAAVMCEDAARTVHLARAYGDPKPLAQDQIDALHRRYTQEYGQQ